jgi:hypothetical protein
MKMMKSSLVAVVSALMLAGSGFPGEILSAQAQMTMHFSAPFISNSGLVGAAMDRHFFTVAVTGFPLKSLMVTLPNDLRQLDGAMVVDRTGQEIEANVVIGEGNVSIGFPQPVQPDTYLTVRLSGVRMERLGGTVLYRVSAVKEGLSGDLPLGTVMIRLPAQN